jgi:hypothetical protein
MIVESEIFFLSWKDFLSKNLSIDSSYFQNILSALKETIDPVLSFEGYKFLKSKCSNLLEWWEMIENLKSKNLNAKHWKNFFGYSSDNSQFYAHVVNLTEKNEHVLGMLFDYIIPLTSQKKIFFDDMLKFTEAENKIEKEVIKIQERWNGRRLPIYIPEKLMKQGRVMYGLIDIDSKLAEKLESLIIFYFQIYILKYEFVFLFKL